MYGISPFWKATTCASRGAWRMSIRNPLTFNIQTSGLSSIRLGNVQSGSKWRILSRSRIAFDFAAPLAGADAETLVNVGQLHVRLLALVSRKLTQPMVRTMPLAQAFGLPWSNGEGRLRASFSASLRQRTAYSSFRCSLQNWSIRPTMACKTSAVSSFRCGFGAGLAFGGFEATAASDIGSDVTIPCRALASLKLSLRDRRMPGPNEMW